MRCHIPIAFLVLATACGSPARTGPGLAPHQLAAARTGPVTIEVVPDRVLIEDLHGSHRIACDLRLRNTGDRPQALRSITVIALDRAGALVGRRVIDSHGISPAIATVAARPIAPGEQLFVFVPADSYPGDVDVARLRYALELVDDAGVVTPAEVEVEPQPHAPRTRLAIPLDGLVTVAAGHSLLDPHRRIDLTHPIVVQIGLRTNSARYAIDLARVDDRGRMFAGDGSTLAQWHGYHAPVLAPGAGTVIAVVDGVPDNRLTVAGVEFTSDPTAAGSLFGNLVVIQHDGEVSLFAHLAAGTIKVAAGDRVTAGQPIAAIGFSGNTDFVHTHYQLMAGTIDSAANAMGFLATAEGLPIYFHDFERVIGARAIRVARDAVDTGDVIRR